MSALSVYVSQDEQKLARVKAMGDHLDGRMATRSSWSYFDTDRLAAGFLEGILRPDNFAENSDVIAAIDGGIYNRDELWALVAEQCDQLHNSEVPLSDAEILLVGYIYLGMRGLLGAIEGDFCIFVYDKRSGIVTLAIDHFGHRPLFYMNGSRGVVCASHLLQFGPFLFRQAQLDPQYISSYLIHCPFAAIQGGHTPFRDIRRLLPAHALTIDIDSLRISSYRYWEPNSIDMRKNTSLDEEVERFNEAVSLSTKRQIDGVKNVGLSLSGGIDSSYIASHLRDWAQEGQSLMAFNYVHEGLRPELDESRWLTDVVDATGLGLTRQVIPHDGPTAFWPGLECSAFDFPGAATNLPFFRAFYENIRAQDVQLLLMGFGENCYDTVGNSTSCLYDLRQAIRTFDIYGVLSRMPVYWNRPNLRWLQILFGASRRPLFDSRNFIDGELRHESLVDYDSTGCWPECWQVETVQDYRYYASVRGGNETAGQWLALDHGIERRSPIRSLAVLKTIMGSPSYVFDGSNREMIFHASKNRLPDSILTRPIIGVDSHLHAKRVSQATARLLGGNEPLQVELRSIVDGHLIRLIMRDVVNGKYNGYICRIMQAVITLEMWLRSHPLVGGIEPITGDVDEF